MSWEHFAHGADIGVRGRRRTLADAFEQAALALTAVAGRSGRVAPTRSGTFRCGAPDDELLLVDWLNALIYEMATRRHAVRPLRRWRSTATRCRPAPGASRWIGSRHQPAVEVKGATYTALPRRADRDDGIWLAQCVVDV